MKNRGLGKPGMERIEAILLSKPDGIDTREMAKVTGYEVTSASKGLGELKKRGTAVHIRGAYGTSVWFHFEHRQNALRMVELRRDKNSDGTKNNHRIAERLANALNFECKPVHRVIPATEAKPLRPAGPNSVWALAA